LIDSSNTAATAECLLVTDADEIRRYQVKIGTENPCSSGELIPRILRGTL
jgi:hypothetical protein